MTRELPRIMVAAPGSGCGKTTVAIGLLRALSRRGFAPAAFKCGPDYIDPLFHRRALGVGGGNLDLWFSDEESARSLLLRGSEGCDMALLEGAMGYYDGVAGRGAEGSSWHVASATRTPALLVLDARGASLSLAALVAGFQSFRDPSLIEGAVLNGTSERAFERAARAIEEETGVSVVGWLPRDARFAFESRHLGLVAAGEVEGFEEKVELIAETVEETFDLERILEIARSAPSLGGEPYRSGRVAPEGGVRLAVARDAAFSFLYEENLRMLEDMGARPVFFSPIEDGALPEGVDGLLLPGGYPELHGEKLEGNVSMRRSVREAVEGGLPTLAECGGFLYLQESLVDSEGVARRMVGALPGEGFRKETLGHFGYVELAPAGDTAFLHPGESVRAHEFHWWGSSEEGSAMTARKPSGQSWPCMVATPTLLAGFPHVYYPAEPDVARRFVEATVAHEEARS